MNIVIQPPPIVNIKIDTGGNGSSGSDTILWYVPDGTEGNSLVIDGSLTFYQNGLPVTPDLTGKTVTAVNRENYELMPVDDLTNNKQFQWAGETPTLTFAVDSNLEATEQIKITYR